MIQNMHSMTKRLGFHATQPFIANCILSVFKSELHAVDEYKNIQLNYTENKNSEQPFIIQGCHTCCYFVTTKDQGLAIFPYYRRK